MPQRALKLVRPHKTYRESRKAALAEVTLNDIKSRLVRTGHHPELRACKMRAVIDAPFQAARIGEAIVTFRYLSPTIISVDSLDSITRDLCAKHRSEYVFQRIKLEARKYHRKEVRHLSWKD